MSPRALSGMTALRDVDAAALKAAEPYRATRAVRALTVYGKLGDQPPLLALSGGVLALGLVRRDARMARAGARMIAAHLLATAVKTFVKHRIDRTRPRNADRPADNEARPGDSHAKSETSFPSGHSAGAIAVALAFGRDYPDYRLPALGAGTLIAAAQVPRFAHYPTDVLAGAAVGWASEVVIQMAWSATSRRL